MEQNITSPQKKSKMKMIIAQKEALNIFMSQKYFQRAL